jgi:hypothetical protein
VGRPGSARARSARVEGGCERVGEEQPLRDAVELGRRGARESLGDGVRQWAELQAQLLADGDRTDADLGLGAGALGALLAEHVGDGLHSLHGLLRVGIGQRGDDVVDERLLLGRQDAQKIAKQRERCGAVVQVAKDGEQRFQVGEGAAPPAVRQRAAPYRVGAVRAESQPAGCLLRWSDGACRRGLRARDAALTESAGSGVDVACRA